MEGTYAQDPTARWCFRSSGRGPTGPSPTYELAFNQPARQHFLCFLPEPQGQRSLRPILGDARTNCSTGA